MKTTTKPHRQDHRRHVYILPLRNENKLLPGSIHSPAGLYPTFKEWKQEFLMARLQNECVYILPLRNENLIVDSLSSAVLGLYPTFKEWKQTKKFPPLKKEGGFISYL